MDDQLERFQTSMKDREVLSQERSKERKMSTDCCDLNILLYLFLAMKIPQDWMLILATSQNKGTNYQQKLVYIAKKKLSREFMWCMW